MNIRKYLNNQNWNIGFAHITPEQLITAKKLPKVKWMKHPYKDRFFADPFILDVDAHFIYVLAEELIFGEKGTLVWLKIERNNFRLLDRKLLLKLDTHLSYPLIMRHGEKIFVLPENSESGCLTIYEFNKAECNLTPIKSVCNEPLTDATPIHISKEASYIVATKLPNSQSDAYLYKFDNISQEYIKISDEPIVKGAEHSRMGGDFFMVNSSIYRPAQDCAKGYGKALNIFEVSSFAPKYDETLQFKLTPKSWKYNLGLHTLNFHKQSEIAVIDAYGYLYPIIGRIMILAYNIKQYLRGRKNS